MIMAGKGKAKMGEGTGYLLQRGVAEVIIPEEMERLLRSGRKLRLKEGFDPSFPDIHLGHMVALRKLRQFQEMGHQVVVIVGDWTARIGDPSGVSVTRPMLSAAQVEANAETYMRQFFKIVDREKTEVRWQSEWFGGFGLGDVIELASRFTVAQLLAREDFSTRYSTGRPISMTELLYPLLQAYDSVAVRADVEFGGTDQKFNLLLGRELQPAAGQTPQQVFMVPLLVGTDGSQKMSKSLGNYIGITEPPDDIFGKVMSIPDSLIIQYFELVTDVSDGELGELREVLDGGSVNPMIMKKRLAVEIVAQLYDAKAAVGAEEHFEKVVQKKGIPDDMPVVEIADRSPDIRHLLKSNGIVGSVSEAARLIKQGALEIDGIKVNTYRSEVNDGSVIQLGKRTWLKIKIVPPTIPGT